MFPSLSLSNNDLSSGNGSTWNRVCCANTRSNRSPAESSYKRSSRQKLLTTGITKQVLFTRQHFDRGSRGCEMFPIFRKIVLMESALTSVTAPDPSSRSLVGLPLETVKCVIFAARWQHSTCSSMNYNLNLRCICIST